MPRSARKRSRAFHRPEVSVHQRKASFAAWTVLGVSLLTVTTGWCFTRSHFQQHLGDRMAVEARDVRDALLERIEQTSQALGDLRTHLAEPSSFGSTIPWPSASPASIDFDHPGVLQVVVVRPSRPNHASTLLPDIEVEKIWDAPGRAELGAVGTDQSFWSRAITRTTPHWVEATLSLLTQADVSEILAVLLLPPPEPSTQGTSPDTGQTWVAALIDLNLLVAEATAVVGVDSRIVLYSHDGDQPQPRLVVETAAQTDSATAAISAAIAFKAGGGGVVYSGSAAERQAPLFGRLLSPVSPRRSRHECPAVRYGADG